jgi:signal transduction histidine kinase
MESTTSRISPPADGGFGDGAAAIGEPRRQHEEYNYFVRALSHDMTANFLLLESSFSRMKRDIEASDHSEIGESVARVEACLLQSKHFLIDLIGLAKTGKVEMEPSRVDVAEIVEEVLFEQRELLEARKAEVDVRRPLPIAWCNRHRVKQIVTNLVRNAIRHGCDPREPRITISGGGSMPASALRPNASKPMAWICVHDNGPGISAEHRETVFQPGMRLSNAAPEGWGMGLAIVRKIAEHYGGEAVLDPQCAVGAAFLVTLPTVDAAESGDRESVEKSRLPRDTASRSGRQIASDPGHPLDALHTHSLHRRHPRQRAEPNEDSF